MSELSIFEKSATGRIAASLPECDVPGPSVEELLGNNRLRSELPLPELSELDVVRHFTRLSHMNYSVDEGFYPLGSCTMKYNPKSNEMVARMPGFSRIHPLQPVETVQGALAVIFSLQEMLAEIAGMSAATIQPAAGAHGELLSMMMIHKYHRSRGDDKRDTVLIPDAAHGTNPASAARCGFKVRTVPTGPDGLTDIDALKEALDDSTAAFMLTNPNTAGLFETGIQRISEMVHSAGGMAYCDGANMNALLGIARPGDMGFDIMHFNLHKTFSTPHGGGGPGCGAIAVKKALEPFLPHPVIKRDNNGDFRYDNSSVQSVGKIHSYYGAFLVGVRAYAYIRSLGPTGLRKVSETAVLNANYIRARLQGSYDLASNRLCMHEVVLTAARQKTENGVKALDICKRLMDYGYHPPTNYFPLIVPEALMIEPTETESKETLDAFCDAMIKIAEEACTNPELLRSAPHHTPVFRLDETAAVKQLDINWKD